MKIQIRAASIRFARHCGGSDDWSIGRAHFPHSSLEMVSHGTLSLDTDRIHIH